tara:strand:- start:221 stop:1159 length:939 start_codon:yes stop_codon:yes gene_type:complete
MPIRKSNFNVQYENKVYSSMMLLADHMLLRNGGYEQKTVNLYLDKASNWKQYGGGAINTYTAPYKQWAADASLNLTAPTFNAEDGVIISRKLWDGAVLTTNVPTGQMTANGFVKDVNIYSSSRSDTDIIFDSYKLSTVNNAKQGIPMKSTPYPGVWLKVNDAYDKPFAFGGGSPLMRSYMSIRAICLSDNPYTLDAILSIFRKLGQKALPVVSDNYNLINDNYGGWDGNTAWNYTGEAHGKDGPWIDDVKVSRIGRKGPVKSANPNAISALVDFNLVYYKQGAVDNWAVSYDTKEWGVGDIGFSGSVTGSYP